MTIRSSAPAFLIFFVLAPIFSLAYGDESSRETAGLADLRLPPVEKESWRFSDFPILAWWGPPGTAKLEDFVAYRDAGFNIHTPNLAADFWGALEKLEEAGLKAMPFRTHQGFGPDPLEIDFEKVKDRESVVGWITHDEPSGVEAVTAAIKAVNERMRDDPERWTLFNLLPPQAQQNPSTRPIIDAAVRNGMPVLSYDHYAIAKDHTNSQAHFDNLELFRQASLDHDVPFWAFALTIQHWHYRRASESDVRWKQFTNLAYGAKGLWYFTYWGPTDWEGWDTVAIVDPKDGAKTDLYFYVQAINRTIQEMGGVLLGLRNEAVFHTSPPDGHRAFEAGENWIADICARDALVSFFRDENGGAYAMIVNKRHGVGKSAAETADRIELHFAAEVKAVEAVSWLDGETGPLDMGVGRATLDVAGGTGVLLRADFKRGEQ